MVKESKLRALARRLIRGGGGEPAHQIFLCVGPNCCTHEQGIEAWKHLQGKLEERESETGPNGVRATKSECFGVCGKGPVAVVYPEESWYLEMNPKRLDRVVEEHLEKGRAVEAFMFEPPPTVKAPLLKKK